MYLLVADRLNYRIVKRLASDLSYVSKIGTGGPGDDQFSWPKDVCSDGTYIYVADSGNNRVVKRLASDLSYVDQVSTGYCVSICTDGVHFYVIIGGYDVYKYRCSNLSYVSKFGLGHTTNDPTQGLNIAEGISTDGIYLYVGGSAGAFFIKLLASNMSYVLHINLGQPEHLYYYWKGSVTDGTYIWIMQWQAPGGIAKCNCSDLSVVWYYGSAGTGDDQFSSPYGNIGYDGTYLYIADSGNNRIKKHLASDGSFVSKIGSQGQAQDDDRFWNPGGLQLTNYNLVPDPPFASAQGGILENTISWNPVAGATSYNIYWSYVTGVTTGDIKITGVTSPYDHTGLAGGTPIYYIVTALIGSDPYFAESDPSNEVSATPHNSANTDGRIIW